MTRDRIPHKVTIFYDIQNDEFLIRIIDEDWIDISKYDTLPVLCKMSDLFVKVIDVDTYENVKVSEDITLIKINDTYVFNTTSSNTITDVNIITAINPSSYMKQNLKYIFEIPFLAAHKF